MEANALREDKPEMWSSDCMRCQLGSDPGHTAHDIAAAPRPQAPPKPVERPVELFGELVSLAGIIGFLSILVLAVATIFGISL